MKNYIDDIDIYFELSGKPESSRESYKRRIARFIKFIEECDRTINDLSESDIQQFILHLIREKHVGSGTVNNYITAVKFFYTHTLDKEWNNRKIPRMKRVKKLPVIPLREDILRLISSASNLKHKSILSILYGSGLRVGEAAKLKIKDINSRRMTIRVESAKHGTSRYSILSENTLNILREYFRIYFLRKYGSYSMEDWLFPGHKRENHINTKSIKNLIIKLRDKLHLDPGISAHTMRHAFATHSLEDGTGIAYIQQLLGHKSLNTTAEYLHMTSKSMMNVVSPLDKA